MSLSKKKVLVTGADGFIGSHLVEVLVRMGAEVKAFSLYNSFDTWGWLDHVASDVRGQFDVFTGDIRDPNGVADAVNGADVVLHLASLIAIPYSYHSPDTYVDVNIKGTLNVLQAARRFGVERVVHTSTSEVYGTAQFVPITEEHPLVGQSPYSASKIGADQIALSFWRSFGTPVAVIRPFNTYGPRQSTRAVIPTIITQIAKGNRIIQLGNLTPTRDFSFVTDTANGFVAMGEDENVLGEVVNFGSGFEVSIRETAEIIANAMGVEIELVSEHERLRPDLSEVERLWASTEKALRLLKWTPSHSGRDGFVKGIEKTVEWFNDPANLARYKTDRYTI
ncbi:NAD-dependent 4,6-dehydratase LegB [Roseibium denhamense]|uniref:dTDP-glucose 4,6-dehydratase n=1 Tax=Roseibium denhamense TaxID=76305 RepID=A0ABY1PM51_9HYPH|nr:NAD-dependent 4,6-dehydratase LegB [Roseibium denhamense]SMP37158.1 dTDP-glucose 4,6-dehydratase [Roseibium denhamense]